ncbi:MAG TPA: hypothetical protein VNM92_10190 [Thermoanaerobaculia bacterium]|nr:hypothetical protein [Thermoanaerobaculia bacterium]
MIAGDSSDGEFDIVILDRGSAAALLTTPQRCSAISYLVSIGDPADEPPAGYGNIARKLRLEFEDSGPGGGPGEHDIEDLIHFARQIEVDPGAVLIHCHAGVSRSSAAAYIILSMVLGPGRETEALERVFAARSIAVPNRRMVEIADRLLSRQGAMIAELASAFPE